MFDFFVLQILTWFSIRLQTGLTSACLAYINSATRVQRSTVDLEYNTRAILVKI